MKIFLSKNKLQIRNYITRNLKKITNIKILIGFFPIFLGIYNKLYYKYYEQTFFTCLKTNLPGIYLKKTKISWHTFDQNLVPQLQVPYKNIDSQNLYKPILFKNAKTIFSNNIYTKKNYCYDYSTQKLNFRNNFILINTNINLYKKQKKLYVGFSNNLAVPINEANNQKFFQVEKKQDFSDKTNKIYLADFLPNQQISNVGFNIYLPEANAIKNNTTLGSNWLAISAKENINSINILKNLYKKTFLNIQSNKRNPVCLASKTYILNKTSLNSYKQVNINKFAKYDLSKKLIKYNNFLTLDELPTKLNHIYNKTNLIFANNVNKFRLTNKNFHTFKNFQTHFFFTHIVSRKHKEFSNVTKHTVFINPTKKFFKNILFSNSKKKLTNFVVKQNFLYLKHQNTNLFPKNNKLSHKVSNKKNLVFFTGWGKKSTMFSPTLLQAVQNFQTNPYIEDFFSKENFDNSCQTKNQYIYDLTKIYSLKTNLTFIPDSKFIQLCKVNSLKKKHNIININQFIHEYNPQKSLQLLKLLESYIYIYKNTKTSFRTMSGYFFPNIKNISNIFKLKNINNILLHIKTSPNYLQLIDPINFHGIFEEFSNTKPFFQNKKDKLNFNFVYQAIEDMKNIEKKNKNTKKQQHYSGLSIIQNVNTNELEMENSSEIQNLINQFLNSDNPLTDHQENFFGQNVSYINSETYKTSIVSKNLFSANKLLKNKQKNIFFIKLPLLNKKFSNLIFQTSLKGKFNQKKNGNTNKIPCYKTIHFPSKIFSKKKNNYVLFLNQQDWIKFLKLKNSKNVRLVSKLPIIPFSQLVFFNSKSCLFTTIFDKSLFYNSFIPNKKTNNTLKQFQLSNQIIPFMLSPVNQLDSNGFYNFTRKNHFETKLSGNFFPHQNNNVCFFYSQKLIRENVPTKFVFNKMYKKNYSVYKNKFNSEHGFTFQNQFFDTKETRLFFKIIQPINKNSWFFTTQFTVGFLLIKILQNISKKYQQELKYAVSSLLESENKDKTSNTSNPNNDKQNFKIIKNIVKNFDNIAGIDNILPELAEITLFLRNSSQLLKTENPIPQKILLTGLPGTGKTFLVQAIAGEAQVPILIESGSSLAQSQSLENSSEKLRTLFNQARKIAPCIVFIDEIDSFGQARNAMMKNPISNNDILQSISITAQHSNKNQNLTNLFNSNKKNITGYKPVSVNSSFSPGRQKSIGTDIENNFNKKFSFSNEISDLNKLKKENSNLLLQFLIELDSISNDKRILVFGATNREQVLDLALTRPGRFNKIIKLKLPNKQKRIEIIKLYTKNLGFIFDNINKNYQQNLNKHSEKINFKTKNKLENSSTDFSELNYLAQLTLGLSAADLASAINQSSIKAIQTETIHTLKTIEYGIFSIRGYTTHKNKLKSFVKIKRWEINIAKKQVRKKQKNINKLAYYQAGKTIVHTLLKKHPSIISIRLWPEFQNSRYHLIANTFQKEFSQLFNKIELESRIIGFYGGKAGEFLNIKQIQQANSNFVPLKSNYYSQSKLVQNSFFTKQSQSIVVRQTWVKNIIQLKKFFYLYQSNFGLQDSNFANLLAFLMVNKWYLYCKEISIQNADLLKQNSNEKQILNKYTNNFLKQTSNQIENIMNIKKSTIKGNYQNYHIRSNIQRKITRKLYTYKMCAGFMHLKKNSWSKVYGDNYQENENTKYITPDIYWSNNSYLKNLKSTKLISLFKKKKSKNKFYKMKLFQNVLKNSNYKNLPILHTSINWNTILQINHDYIYTNLILICFNKAISIINYNRELLDLFASFLLQNEILREYKIKEIINTF